MIWITNPFHPNFGIANSEERNLIGKIELLVEKLTGTGIITTTPKPCKGADIIASSFNPRIESGKEYRKDEGGRMKEEACPTGHPGGDEGGRMSE